MRSVEGPAQRESTQTELLSAEQTGGAVHAMSQTILADQGETAL